jgi:hypothetical protein
VAGFRPAATANQTGTEPNSSNDGRRNVRFTFDLSGGDYDYYVRVNADGGNNDSFYFRLQNTDGLDTGWVRWWSGLQTDGAWDWKSWSGSQFDGLAASDYTLDITYREDGTHIDKFVVQDASKSAPSGFGPAETPAGGAGNF